MRVLELVLVVASMSPLVGCEGDADVFASPDAAPSADAAAAADAGPGGPTDPCRGGGCSPAPMCLADGGAPPAEAFRCTCPCRGDGCMPSGCRAQASDAGPQLDASFDAPVDG